MGLLETNRNYIKELAKLMCIDQDLNACFEFLDVNSCFFHRQEYCSISGKQMWSVNSEKSEMEPSISITPCKRKFGAEEVEVNFTPCFLSHGAYPGVCLSVLNLGYDRNGKVSTEYRFHLDEMRTFNISDEKFKKNWFKVEDKFFNKIEGNKFVGQFLAASSNTKSHLINNGTCIAEWKRKVFELGQSVLCQVDC